MILVRARGRRGFSLIELSVVVLVLAMLAATVVPRLVALRRGDEVRRFKMKLPALIGEARSRAISSGETAVVQLQASENRFGLASGAESSESQAKTISLPGDAAVQKTRIGRTEGEASDWEIRFFPDGTCQGGAIEFRIDGSILTLVVDGRSGRAQWTEGGIPPIEDEEWAAGELEIRGEGP